MRISDWSSDVCSSDLKQERSADAIAAYRAVPEDSALSWIVRLRIADELQVMGETEQALAEFDRLAAQRPESYEPLSRQGDLLRSAERLEEAVEAHDGAAERLESQGELGPHHSIGTGSCRGRVSTKVSTS